jgi:hypothetical protein
MLTLWLLENYFDHDAGDGANKVRSPWWRFGRSHARPGEKRGQWQLAGGHSNVAPAIAQKTRTRQAVSGQEYAFSVVCHGSSRT